jgi:hypothetical protein
MIYTSENHISMFKVAVFSAVCVLIAVAAASFLVFILH